MEEMLPSRLWQPNRSWSRRDAAKASMAACVRETSQMQVRSGQVRSGQLPRPESSPVLGRKQL